MSEIHAKYMGNSFSIYESASPWRQTFAVLGVEEGAQYDSADQHVLLQEGAHLHADHDERIVHSAGIDFQIDGELIPKLLRGADVRRVNFFDLSSEIMLSQLQVASAFSLNRNLKIRKIENVSTPTINRTPI